MVLDDLEVVLNWRNHPDVRRHMYTQHEISLSEHRAWFERAEESPREHLLVLESGSVGIGYARIHVQDDVAKRAVWGFYRAPEAPRGTGFQLCERTLEYAFRDLSLHKVSGEVLASNARSIALHRRLGFREEARFRDHQFDGGRYWDSFGFGLLESEWTTNLGAQICQN